MLLLFFVGYLIFIGNHLTNAYCPDDEDLQRHQCQCNLVNKYIQCSSIPKQCRTCYRYDAIFFDETVTMLPVEVFRFYDFYDTTNNNNWKKVFKIQFAQLNVLSSNSFSKIDVEREGTLEIKILKYSSPVLPSRIFEDLAIKAKAKVTIDIFNVTSTMLTIEQYALDGIRFDRESQFRLSILYAKDTIQFESNAGSILLPSYAYMELYFSNFIQVVLEEHSFDHITQEHSSELNLNFDRFQYATLAHNAFFDFHQLDLSRFHFSLSNLQSLTIEQTLFDTITQLKSSIIISIYNLTTDLCLPSKTFSQIKQDVNSTFQLEINYSQNILFRSDAFIHINQKLESKISVSIANSYDVYFSRYSLNNLHQEDRSLIDIWIKYGQNLIFEDYAINNIDIYRSSILRIGFQHSRGTLQMAINAFSNINEGQGGELLFQIMNSSDFYFRFNESTSLKRLEIVDRTLSSADLCHIANIPSHIPIKLIYDNQCSCTVYYLYRHLHRKLLPSVLRDLTPLCYINMTLDEIEYAEHECSFETQIHNCQQMEGQIQIDIPQGICENTFKVNRNMNKHRPEKKSSFSTFIFILIILGCLIFSCTCLYLLFSKNRRLPSWDLIRKHITHYRRQKLTIYSADSYQQLTHIDQQEPNARRRKLMVKYNSTTQQTQPYLDIEKSDFIVSNDNDEEQNEDTTLKLNTNPMSDIEDNALYKTDTVSNGRITIHSLRENQYVHFVLLQTNPRMISALGHCEDPACHQTPPSSHDLVRLFRCSIHCNRNLCLFHLNAHNVYYEQEKRQNDIITRELENALTLYQKLFEQHITTYHELVRQATTIIFHNTSTLIPTNQIRNVLTNVQRAIAIFEQELVIKCDPALNTPATEIKTEETKSVITLDDDINITVSADKENDPPVTIDPATARAAASNDDACQTFVVRVPRLDNIATESTIEIINTNREQAQSTSPAYTARRVTEGARIRGRSVKRLQK